MYPLDVDYAPNEFDTFAALRESAEAASNALNLPLSWWFGDSDEPGFTLVFVMPRKGNRAWSMTTLTYDRDEVQAWLDTWLRGEISEWFGWEETPDE